MRDERVGGTLVHSCIVKIVIERVLDFFAYRSPKGAEQSGC